MYNKRVVADVAQLVEQRIRNAWVGCSSLLSGTITKSTLSKVLFRLVLQKNVYILFYFANNLLKTERLLNAIL